MAGIPHDHYEPKTSGERWLHKRLPIVGLLYDTIMIPTPKNLNWMWIWGIVLTFCLALQIVTGIILAMHYTPHVDMAFASVEHIMRNVNGGYFIRYLHMNGASLFFFAVYLHIFRGLYYGSYKAPREITWIVGMIIYLLMMGTAFMGYVLPWGQMSFWGATVITGLFGAIPGVGESIQTWLLGGPAVDNATLNRFFSLHYLLPFVIAALVAVHIWAFHTTGNNNPTGVEVRRGSKEEAERDTVPFWPYFVIKDLFALAVILAVFFAIVGFMPNYLGHPDNYIEANPLGDARAYRAGMVLPAVLRDPARLHRGRLGGDRGGMAVLRHHRRQVLRRAGDVRRNRGHGAGALARHLLGALGPLSPDVQVVVRAAGDRLHRPDVVRRHARGRALCHDLADRLGLLVRLLPGDPAASGRDREAAGPARDHRGRLQRTLCPQCRWHQDRRGRVRGYQS
jgi:quinol-cytochrome oxidoreductase complex cytochrome b subunit